MSLDYNLGKIENYKDVCYIKATEDHFGIKAGDLIINPTTQTIIFGCIPVGIGAIKNEIEAKEWFIRYEIWCRVTKLDNPITHEDVVRHVGLTTNVFPRKTDTQWRKDILTNAISDIKWDMAKWELAKEKLNS